MPSRIRPQLVALVNRPPSGAHGLTKSFRLPVGAVPYRSWAVCASRRITRQQSDGRCPARRRNQRVRPCLQRGHFGAVLFETSGAMIVYQISDLTPLPELADFATLDATKSGGPSCRYPDGRSRRPFTFLTYCAPDSTSRPTTWPWSRPRRAVRGEIWSERRTTSQAIFWAWVSVPVIESLPLCRTAQP